MLTEKPVRIAALGAALALSLGGCAAIGVGNSAQPSTPTSVQTLEYYPYLVKGYQSTFPHRSMIVLLPVDAGDSNGVGTPLDGNPEIGEITDKAEIVVQRLYSQPLPSIVQNAIVLSAGEAGFSSSAGGVSIYEPGAKKSSDYVMTTRITRCWVKKHRGPDGRFGPTWSTVADFTLEVTVYKPPFKVPFWQGTSSQPYYDPPIGSFGLGPEDEAGIYDEPGQVLSVAMTRTVAGIFERDDLRALVQDDHMNASR